MKEGTVHFDTKKSYDEFKKLRDEVGLSTPIYALDDGTELDVRGQKMGSDGTVVPFDFGRGSRWDVDLPKPESTAELKFIVPSDGRYWMNGGFGATRGDMVFELSQNDVPVAGGNNGIDESAPVQLFHGEAVIHVRVNPDSEDVQKRVKEKQPATRGYYILRARS